MNIHQLARTLGGEVSNGQVLAPGPGHSRRDRSLAVRLSWQAPDGFIVFSHAGDDWRDCADYVRGRLGLARDPVDRAARQAAPVRRDPDARMRSCAQEIFAEATDPRVPIVETYLAVERKMPDALDDTLALTLRFHPRCPFRDDGKLVRSPALVCALRDPRLATGACSRLGDMDMIERAFLTEPANVVAVQRIRLTADGKKVERKTLGPMENAVVFVSSIWESFYSATATIAEGVETALAMRALGFSGAVALAGAGRFRSFDPPFHWGCITISGENDAGASQSAWRDAGPRWAAAGHDVEIWTPPDGFKDANDLLRDKRQ